MACSEVSQLLFGDGDDDFSVTKVGVGTGMMVSVAMVCCFVIIVNIAGIVTQNSGGSRDSGHDLFLGWPARGAWTLSFLCTLFVFYLLAVNAHGLAVLFAILLVNS